MSFQFQEVHKRANVATKSEKSEALEWRRRAADPTTKLGAEKKKAKNSAQQVKVRTFPVSNDCRNVPTTSS
jgi:hypothetical protein